MASLSTDRKFLSVQEEIVQEFCCMVSNNMAIPVSAMKALITAIRRSNATTWMQLEEELAAAIDALKTCGNEDLQGRTNISLHSGCELFMRYVTRAFLEYQDFDACKAELIVRGQSFADMSMKSRSKIAEYGRGFIQEDFTILIHGFSRVVLSLLLAAAKGRHFSVLVTECRPENNGYSIAQKLAEADIAVTMIADNGVGYVMERVDLCLVGAEGVLENGGIVNKLGTYQLALAAHAHKKPFYVAAESYKFSRLYYPLTQRDLRDAVPQLPLQTAVPDEESTSTRISQNSVQVDNPAVDFTPARFITLLITDLGVLTPAAVSDELIRLYQ